MNNKHNQISPVLYFWKFLKIWKWILSPFSQELLQKQKEQEKVKKKKKKKGKRLKVALDDEDIDGKRVQELQEVSNGCIMKTPLWGLNVFLVFFNLFI